MADSNEAQLLSDLLHDVASEDARFDAAHLEARVMAAVEAAATVRLKPDTPYSRAPYSRAAYGRARSWAAAAAVAAASIVPATYWIKTQVPVEKAQVTVNATEEVVAHESNAGGRTQANGPARANGPAELNGPAEAGHYVLPRIAKSAVTPSGPVAESAIAKSLTAPIAPTAPSAPTAHTAPLAPATQSRDEFVPLMPMTEQELSGPFQIVRVQMPRASLGALRSPLDRPNELVEADVLLGEDGMARAIRVSTSGSVYPWRSR